MAIDNDALGERNNLLYVAASRAERHLYLYQETEYNSDNLAPQLQQLPRNFDSVTYSGPSLQEQAAAPRSAFEPPSEMPFEHFDSYVTCPLQYWYSHVIGLRSEADIDVSVRARWAVMAALKMSSSGNAGTAESHLALTWTEGRLPTEGEDPSLWRDAQLAFSWGLDRVQVLRDEGGEFFEPKAEVNGLTVSLPWGFLIPKGRGAEFAMLRFVRRRASEIATALKPMVPTLNTSRFPKTMTLNYVLSDKYDEVPGAKMPEKTKSFKATLKLYAGDNQPNRGRHCSRCGFTTMCPAAPS